MKKKITSLLTILSLSVLLFNTACSSDVSEVSNLNERISIETENFTIVAYGNIVKSENGHISADTVEIIGKNLLKSQTCTIKFDIPIYACEGISNAINACSGIGYDLTAGGCMNEFLILYPTVGGTLEVSDYLKVSKVPCEWASCLDKYLPVPPVIEWN